MKKLIAALLALAALSLMLTPVGAQGVSVYTKKDKVQYAPGEQGTISIVIRNTGTEVISIKNLTIAFTGWMLYTVDGWDELGNKTIVYSDITVTDRTGVVKLEDISFTVPTDDRARDTNVDIWIYTNKSPIYVKEGIDVVDPSTQNAQRALDNIVMLLTVVAILAIIGAIIVAAAIFLSGRRPGVTWQKEE